jgi:hypothetical protein
MKSFIFTLLGTLICSSIAFTPSSSPNKLPNANTQLTDVASIAADPEMMKGILQASGDQLYTLAGGAAAAIAAGFAVLKGKGDDAQVSKPKVIDVSIPYNAAAKLAFSTTNIASGRFSDFETLYHAKAVADVTAKKMARDVVEMKKVAETLAKQMEAL